MFDIQTRDIKKELQQQYGPPPGAIAGEWYDEKYYEKPGTKSNWPYAYTWDNFNQHFRKIANLIITGFPFSKSFLDVGCAKGLLLRAMLEHAAQNCMQITLHGFDHSKYAIENADPLISDLVECASIDDFVFTQKYDVIMCFDILEHLTEMQSSDFLLRANRYTNHAIVAVIPDEDYPNDIELSHINKKPRIYWDNTFRLAGWVQDENAKNMQEAIMTDSWVRAVHWNVYYYVPKGVVNV